MTLMGLADKLGIAYQQVQKYEKGVNRMGAGRLMAIAEILNTPVASFFDADRGRTEAVVAAPPSALPSADVELALQGRELLASFFHIKDPEKRKMVLGYAYSLAESKNRSHPEHSEVFGHHGK